MTIIARALAVTVGSAPSPLDTGWIGHEWRARGFFSDECIHCGTIAVEGHNGLVKNHEHCAVRAGKQPNPASLPRRDSDVGSDGLFDGPASDSK